MTGDRHAPFCGSPGVRFPGATRHCKDANRRGDFGHTSFDFLGYTFRGRLASGPRGYFTGFSPAISAKARKAKGKQIRDWHLNRLLAATLSAHDPAAFGVDVSAGLRGDESARGWGVSRAGGGGVLAGRGGWRARR